MPRRDSRGRFVKSGGGSRSRSRTTTAIVRAPAARPIIVRAPATPARRRGGGRRRSVGGGRIPFKVKGEMGLYGALAGYFQTQKASTWNQIPTTGKLPREIVLGGAIHFFNKKNKHADRAAAALIAVGGFKLGEQGFKLSGFEDDE